MYKIWKLQKLLPAQIIYDIQQEMSLRIPPLLEPYLALPSEASLILLTSVLGASSNWLVLRFLYSVLQTQDVNPGMGLEDDTKVLLVSFMRDYAFWKENSRRLVSFLVSSLFDKFEDEVDKSLRGLI